MAKIGVLQQSLDIKWSYNAKGEVIRIQLSPSENGPVSLSILVGALKNQIIDTTRLTPFQKKVLEEVSQIPLGETRYYAEIAQNIGMPKAARAVGTALANNPFPLYFPCHRVVPKSGGIGQYSCGETKENGQEIKKHLLDSEKHLSKAEVSR